MITKADDYPIHQLPHPVSEVGTERNFYDRYFFNGYSKNEDFYFAAVLSSQLEYPQGTLDLTLHIPMTLSTACFITHYILAQALFVNRQAPHVCVIFPVDGCHGWRRSTAKIAPEHFSPVTCIESTSFDGVPLYP